MRNTIYFKWFQESLNESQLKDYRDMSINQQKDWYIGFLEDNFSGGNLRQTNVLKDLLRVMKILSGDEAGDKRIVAQGKFGAWVLTIEWCFGCEGVLIEEFYNTNTDETIIADTKMFDLIYEYMDLVEKRLENERNEAEEWSRTKDLLNDDLNHSTL